MSRRFGVCSLMMMLAVSAPVLADPDLQGIMNLARCQRQIGRQGARFAQRVIKSTLHCTEEVTECQVECDEGVFGPPCDDDPVPGCCDSDESDSNEAFAACMASAQGVCDSETQRRAVFESSKQENITAACTVLTQDQLCGAQTIGLNFATLNAGCQALDPNYTCNLTNLINCVGGPLERALLDQISATLAPRASDAVAALNLESQFPDIPVTRKVKGSVAEGKVDVWQFTGQAGDQIVARVNTRADTAGGSSSSLHPMLALLDSSLTSVANTNIRSSNCGVPTVCGSSCPLFKRTLPFDGIFNLAVEAYAPDSCGGGNYKLILVTPGGATPTLVCDDCSP